MFCQEGLFDFMKCLNWRGCKGETVFADIGRIWHVCPGGELQQPGPSNAQHRVILPIEKSTSLEGKSGLLQF